MACSNTTQETLAEKEKADTLTENEVIEENCMSNTNENNNVLDSWTKAEKFELLQILKVCGSHNIEEIQSLMPDKAIEEIEKVIHHYKEKALHHPTLLKKKNNNKLIDNTSKVPLAAWVDLLMESLQYNDLQTETATALRLIAEFENIPAASASSDVDFRQVYHALANALEGKTLPDDPLINFILEKCIIETAYTSRSFIKNSSLRQVIDSVDFTEDISVFPRPTDDDELAAVRHLAVQRNYNPLHIAEEHLQSSFVTNRNYHID